MHFFTLHEIDVMFTACGFVVRSLSAVVQPMPPQLGALLTAAVALGAERAETEARLNAYQYLLVATGLSSAQETAADRIESATRSQVRERAITICSGVSRPLVADWRTAATNSSRLRVAFRNGPSTGA